MAQKFKAIFFDCDGLLVDTETLWLEACRGALAPYGIEISEEFYIEEVLNQGHSLLVNLGRQNGMSEEKIQEVRKYRNDLYKEMLRENIKVIDGVRETLDKLHGKFVMGIVTTSYKDDFDIIMERTGLGKYFSFFVTFEDVSKPKPDPEPYLKAWQMSGFAKEECLVLEDSLRGVEAAKAAGLTCYAIPEGWTRNQDFSIADKVLDNIRELSEIIL